MNTATAAYIAAHREQSAAEIAAALAADPRFARRITKDPLRALLQSTLIGAKMQLAWENQALPLELRGGLLGVIQTAQYDNGYIDTQDLGIAAKIRLLAPTVVALGILTQAEADALLALAGGPLLDHLSEGEVQAELDRLAAVDALRELLDSARAQSATILAADREAMRPAQEAYTQRSERHTTLFHRLQVALRDAEGGALVTVPNPADISAELEA